MLKSDSVSGSCQPTEFSVIASVVHIRWIIAIDAEFLFSSAGFAVCLCAHLSPNLHPNGALNFVHSGKSLKLHQIPFWQLHFLKFVQGSLFAFPDGLLPVNFGVPFALPSVLPFPSPFEFWCSEPVGEGERSRPFDFLVRVMLERMLLQLNIGLL